MHNRVLPIVAALFALLCNTPADAVLLKYNFKGFVARVDSPLAGGPVSQNDPMVGSFIVESQPRSKFASSAFYSISSLAAKLGNNYSITSPIANLRVHTFGSSTTMILDATRPQGMTAPTVDVSYVPDYFFFIIDRVLPPSLDLPKQIDFSVAGSALSGLRFNVNDNIEYHLRLTSFSVAAVPLPAGLPLLGSAILLLGAVRRFRKRAEA